ncbi:MAG: ankyrin repeat domain-containing protein [Acidobacteriota bacterium]
MKHANLQERWQQALSGGDRSEVRALLRQHPELVKSGDAPSWRPTDTPLHRVESRDLAEILIEAGCCVDQPGFMGLTPLHQASLEGREGVVEALLNAGADPNGGRGPSPLSVAATPKIAALLLQHGADPEASSVLGGSPLHQALREGRLDVVEVLCEHGADLGARNDWSLTPLHQAVEARDLDAVRLLCRHGADIELRDVRGHSAWSLARARGYDELLEALQPPPDAPEALALETAVKRLRVHPNRPEAIAALEHARLVRWSLREGSEAKPLMSLATGHASLSGVAVSPDGELVATGSHDGRVEIRRWDTLELVNTCLVPAAGRQLAPITAIDWSPDGLLLAVAVLRGPAVVLDAKDWSVRWRRFPPAAALTLAFARDSSRLAVAVQEDGRGAVEIHDLAEQGSGPLVLPLQPDESCGDQAVTAVAFSPDGELVASFELWFGGTRPQRAVRVSLHDARTGFLRWRRDLADDLGPGLAGRDFVSEVVFDESGAELLCGAPRGQVLRYSVESGCVLGLFEVDGGGDVGSLARAPGGRLWAGLDRGGVRALGA